jgi:hypothetical protein
LGVALLMALGAWVGGYIGSAFKESTAISLLKKQLQSLAF